MILVDSSVWIDHFRYGNDHLKMLLREDKVLTHEFIIGELLLGSIKNRQNAIHLLNDLSMSIIARHDEVVHLVEKNNLINAGIGWIDIHLLASAMLSKTKLYTLDKKLYEVSKIFKVEYRAC